MNDAQINSLLVSVAKVADAVDRIARKLEPVLDYALEEIKKERSSR